MSLNPSKTWCINFHRDNKNKNFPHLYLSGNLLKYKKTYKFLGITFDESLSFKDHIEIITKKCQKRLNLLKAIRGRNWGASPETIMYTYKAYIRPILEYGCTLFAFEDQSLLKKIQNIETSAIKIAYLLPPWTTNT